MTPITTSKVIDQSSQTLKTQEIKPITKLSHNPFHGPFYRLMGLCGLLGLVMSGPASALKPEEIISLEKRLRPSQTQSVDDIARQIRQQHEWRILAAEPTVSDEKTFYRFKLLNKKRGRISIVVIDPNEPNLQTLN